MLKNKQSKNLTNSTHQSKKTKQENEKPHYSLSDFFNFINNNFTIIFVVGLTFILGFLSGSIWSENKLIKKGIGVTQPNQIGQVEPMIQPEGPNQETLKKVPPVSKQDQKIGTSNPKVVMIEYSDFECPFCNRFHPTMKKLLENYPDKIQWVYRHYPLSFHPNAQKSAEASECVAYYAGNEAFWKFADTLFERVEKSVPNALAPSEFTNILKEQKIANNLITKIASCIESGEKAQIVQEEFAGGNNAGISGTPGTIVITKSGEYMLVPGAVPYEEVLRMIKPYLE